MLSEGRAAAAAAAACRQTLEPFTEVSSLLSRPHSNGPECTCETIHCIAAPREQIQTLSFGFLIFYFFIFWVPPLFALFKCVLLCVESEALFICATDDTRRTFPIMYSAYSNPSACTSRPFPRKRKVEVSDSTPRCSLFGSQVPVRLLGQRLSVL